MGVYRSSPSAGVTQLVECDLAKVDVAGSNPVSRSKFLIVRVETRGMGHCNQRFVQAFVDQKPQALLRRVASGKES